MGTLASRSREATARVTWRRGTLVGLAVAAGILVGIIIGWILGGNAARQQLADRAKRKLE